MEPTIPVNSLISLKGKTALVTGAASGIGAATAKRLAEAGADLMLLDIDADRLSILKDSLASSAAAIHTYPIDLSQKTEIDTFWNTLGQNELDILVNNAGVFPFKDYLETDEIFLQKIMDINFTAVYWMCQHFVRQRLALKAPGAIVNIGSIEAMLPFKEHMAHYTTSKSAVVALTRALARDYGRKGIRANVILPGGIRTEGVASKAKGVWRNPSLIKDGILFMSRLPLGRFGQPDEVARIVLVLVSDLSSYMTGAVVSVDGGFLSA